MSNNVPSLNQNPASGGLPDVLKSTLKNEMSNVEVESIILPSVAHTFNPGGYAQTTFRLPKKGVLDSHSSLVYEVLHTSHVDPVAQNVDTGATTNLNGSTASPQRFTGLLPIRTAQLFVGGKLFDELQNVQEWLAMSKSFGDYQTRSDVFDVKLGSDNRYEVDDNGNMKMKDSPVWNAKGSRVCQLGRAPQCSILLQDLFASLKDVQLPLSDNFPEVNVVITWESEGDKVLVSNREEGCANNIAGLTAGDQNDWESGELCAGDVATKANGQAGNGGAIAGGGGVDCEGILKCKANGTAKAVDMTCAGRNIADSNVVRWSGLQSGTNTGTRTSYTITTHADPQLNKAINIRQQDVYLICDFIHYPAEVNQAIVDQLEAGMSFPFTNRYLIKKQLPAVAANTELTTDVMVGLQGKYVKKLFVQKLNSTYANMSAVNKVANLMLKQRSDYLGPGEKYQLIVNNKPVIDREIDNEAFKYSFLNQAWGNGEHLAVLPDQYSAVHSEANRQANNLQLSDEAVRDGGAEGTKVFEYGKASSGRMNWVGISLAKSDGGKAELNPVMGTLFNSAPALLRVSRNGGAIAEHQQAVDMNVWAETIKQANISNGKIQIIDY